MKKVIIIGCPGSGKSTFSKKLRDIIHLPLYHLDMIGWNTDRTKVDNDVFLERLLNIVEKCEWIIDGNYSSTIELRLKECDTVFFLDYASEICLEGIRQRRGIPRTDTPWTEKIDEEDKEFLSYVKNYNDVCRPNVINLLNKYCNKQIIIFKNREESIQYLEQLKGESL